MSTEQHVIIRTLGVNQAFDPVAEIRSRVRFLADYLMSSGSTTYVLGISGGVGSFLAGMLAQLKREGVDVNWKKLYRLYKEERLTARKRGGRKPALGTRAPMAIPQGPNQLRMEFS